MNLVDIENMYKKLKCQYNISRMDALILYMISEGERIAYHMAKVVHYDRTSIVKRIKKLEEKNFLTSQHNGKSKVLSLTEKGNSVVENIEGYN